MTPGTFSRWSSLPPALAALVFASCGAPARPAEPAGPAGAGAPARGGSAELADVVLEGGDIWTVDPQHPRVAAVAWRGDRIVAAGDAAAVLVHAGPATKVIDLHGRAASPGLVDAHCHLYELGGDLEAVSVRDLPSEAAAVQALATAAKARAASEWLVGRGWDQNHWPGQQFPTARSLDAAIADRPVVVTRIDGHAMWVNTAALRGAGITRSTVDPPGGKIVRDPRGEPTGVLIDNAMGLIAQQAPVPTPELRERRIRAAAQVAIAAGLTGVHDMGIDDVTAGVYRKLAAEHQLPLRVTAYLGGAGVPLERFATPPEPPTGRFAMRGVKLYADGALGSRGARLYAGYTDDPKNQGLWRTDPSVIARTVDAAVAGGWQVAVHAIGDAGVGAVLDAYLAANAAHPGEHRLRVEHAQVVAARDVPRFVAARAIASMQPTHATSDMGWAEARLGHERVLGAYAWRTMLDHHIPFAGGSDFPVERVSPLLGLYAAVSRQNAEGKPAGGWYPEQRMTLLEALDAFTHGAAYAEGSEDVRGVIAVGRRADFTVYSGPLTADRHLLDLQVDYTIVDGEIVFQREAAR